MLALVFIARLDVFLQIHFMDCSQAQCMRDIDSILGLIAGFGAMSLA